MPVRAVEGKKSYTGGIGIEITDDKVINLRLRGENNLIEYDEGDNEIYVDLQLDDEIAPTDELPVGITTGRIIVDNGWEFTGTILVAKTTSGDLIKFVYADDGKIYLDNGTGTFKQIYTKTDIDALLNAVKVEIKNYVDEKISKVIAKSDTAPSNPSEGDLWYDTVNDTLKVYDGTQWNSIGGGGSTYSAGTGINIDSNNEISNTGVLTVNGSSGTGGAVIVNDVKIGSTSPQNPTAGMVWYDTTNNVLKTYNGTQWNEVGGSSSVAWGQITGTLSNQTDLQNALDTKQDVLTAGNGITISSATRSRSASTLSISVDTQVVATQEEMADKQDSLTAGDNITIEQVGLVESDMQGPCPSGFHIPTNAEWTALRNILVNTFGFSSGNASSCKTYLKMPYAGRRAGENSATESQNSTGNYWASNTYDSANAHYLNIQQYNFSMSTAAKSFGYSIRAFKNTPVPATSSWTVLYDGSSIATGAGIFHNTTDGLISISGDGSTWTTIADKNLGATTVYNSGDTVSQSNCGYYYQWGNNNGFARTGSVTISSTRVDASSNGPRNYYSSDTFICVSYNSWDTTANANLRGGVTQGTWISSYETVISAENGLTAGTNVSIGDEPQYITITHSDMQGPAPTGFHVPTIAEWTGVLDAGTILGAWTNIDKVHFETYLKLPQCQRIYWDGTQDSSGSYYWTCEEYASEHKGYNLDIASSTISPSDFSTKSNGFAIRAFKDTPSVPDSGWTTLYNGSSVATGAGIFYDSTNGLISISANGTTWYTIMDKNLGATVVYEYGNTMNSSNCGLFYQWGNNYGFPYSGPSLTSSTAVYASGYGPGNYYSSSTFITAAQTWDLSNNDNLWGGDSQGTWDERTPTGETVLTIKATPTVGVVAPPAETGAMWYDTTTNILKMYDGTNWNPCGGGASYTAGNGIDITNNQISVDSNTVAMQSDVSVVSGDAGVTYIIKKSTTPPPAGTPSNVLTFVG